MVGDKERDSRVRNTLFNLSVSYGRSSETQEHITMNFLAGLPCTQKGHDNVWVAVDRLKKSGHFLPFKTTYSMNKLGSIYVAEIV